MFDAKIEKLIQSSELLPIVYRMFRRLSSESPALSPAELLALWAIYDFGMKDGVARFIELRRLERYLKATGSPAAEVSRIKKTLLTKGYIRVILDHRGVAVHLTEAGVTRVDSTKAKVATFLVASGDALQAAFDPKAPKPSDSKVLAINEGIGGRKSSRGRQGTS